MFNSTHTLAGLGIARCGIDRWAPHAIWTAVIAANLPDIDLIAEFSGTGSYLTYHRGISHSVIGIMLLSLALAAAMHWISGSFPRHLAVAVIAMATHPALDFLNTYGLRPLFPLERHWIYGDILFIIDPYADVLLLAGLIAGRYALGRRRLAAAMGLAAMLLYVAARTELRDMARDQMQSFTAHLEGYVSSAVTPRMLNPFTWTGIVETDENVFSVDVSAFQGVGRELSRMRKTADSPAVDAARRTPAAAELLNFARFPVIQVETTSFGQRVTFIDFRFYREESESGLAAIVDLNPSLEILHQSIGFNQRVPTAPPTVSTSGRP